MCKVFEKHATPTIGADFQTKQTSHVECVILLELPTNPLIH